MLSSSVRQYIRTSEWSLPTCNREQLLYKWISYFLFLFNQYFNLYSISFSISFHFCVISYKKPWIHLITHKQPSLPTFFLVFELMLWGTVLWAWHSLCYLEIREAQSCSRKTLSLKFSHPGILHPMKQCMRGVYGPMSREEVRHKADEGTSGGTLGTHEWLQRQRMRCTNKV